MSLSHGGGAGLSPTVPSVHIFVCKLAEVASPIGDKESNGETAGEADVATLARVVVHTWDDEESHMKQERPSSDKCICPSISSSTPSTSG